RATGRGRPGPDRDPAVRLRYRPVAGRDAAVVRPAGMAAVACRPRGADFPNGRESVLQPPGAAVGGIAGNTRGVAAPGDVFIPARRFGLAAAVMGTAKA